ncbi:MAG: septum site-determining protein MinD [Firmicutes bacterium]|jgi:septum site-determining protein MinD|nr:septum site-determining protein MinD [Bacillota bacterium]
MSGTVIVVTSGKGGVGKTTVVANIGAAIASFGPKVALVDADIGLRNLDIVLGLENRIVYDLVNVVEGKCSLRKALIRHKKLENLSLLPASQSRDKSAVSPEQMRALAEELREEYDFVIVDCPAGIEQGFKNAIAGADRAVVVTTPEMSAARDADRIIGLLESEDIRDRGLVINRIRPDMVRRRDMMDVDDILELLGCDLLGVVPDDESVIVSTNRGEPVALDERSKAGRAFRDIASRLMGNDLPIAATTENEGLFNKLMRWVGLARG